MNINETQALGVALSCQAEQMTMHEAQDRASDMLEHLRRMGFDVVPVGEPNRRPRPSVGPSRDRKGWWPFHREPA